MSISTPFSAFTAAITASKLTVTYSVMLRSKASFNDLSVFCAPPYEYACVILSSFLFPFSVTYTYVSLYTDRSFTSFFFR